MGAIDPDAFAAVMDLNVRPALQLTQALLPGMRAAKFGRIINVTSIVTRGLGFAQATPRQRQRWKVSHAVCQ